MSSDFDAVIAALRIALQVAKTRTCQYRWQTNVMNRWVVATRVDRAALAEIAGGL